MDTVNFSLPGPMREFVEAQIKSGRYGNISEYMRELIRRDQDRAEQARLDGLLLRSFDSLEASQGIEVTPEFWREKRQALLKRSAANLKSRKKNTPRE